MANMKYCRFENTVRDMEDCIEALEEVSWDLASMMDDASSDFESRAMKKFISLCSQVAEMFADEDIES